MIFTQSTAAAKAAMARSTARRKHILSGSHRIGKCSIDSVQIDRQGLSDNGHVNGKLTAVYHTCYITYIKTCVWILRRHNNTPPLTFSHLSIHLSQLSECIHLNFFKRINSYVSVVNNAIHERL